MPPLEDEDIRSPKTIYKEKAQRLNTFKIFRGCMDCGYNLHPHALEFDHRPGTTKKFNIGAFRNRSWETLLDEIKKCDVVCSNCHKIRTATRRLSTWERFFIEQDRARRATVLTQ